MADQIPLYFKDEFSPDTENRRKPSEGAFPEIARIPHNYGHNTVDSILKIDLKHEKHLFIVTGYTSLLRVVRLIASLEDDQDLRLLIGNEPFPITNTPMSLAPVTFPEEVQKVLARQTNFASSVSRSIYGFRENSLRTGGCIVSRDPRKDDACKDDHHSGSRDTWLI